MCANNINTSRLNFHPTFVAEIRRQFQDLPEAEREEIISMAENGDPAIENKLIELLQSPSDVIRQYSKGFLIWLDSEKSLW